VTIATVIPTFDRPRSLAAALESVAGQTRLPDEVLVVMDGGPPRDDVAEAFAGRLAVRWLRLGSNAGQAAARNHALARTDAEAVAFLDDDDLFRERHLERLERALRQTPGVALVYDDAEVRLTGPAGEESNAEPRHLDLEYDAARMRRWDYVPPSTWLARADALQRAGGFDAALRCYEDWDLLLRLEAWGGARHVPGPGAVVHIRPAASPGAGGESPNQSLAADGRRLEMLARFQAKHGLSGIPPMTFWEVAAAVRPVPER
jgi:glycosyltransferase involved in cell wall biosynthesis